MIHQLAAASSVEPWDYTLRELKWRADSLRMEIGNYVAWVCIHIPTFAKRRRRRFEDYHPVLAGQQQVSLAAMREFMDWASKILPQKLSETEKQKGWEEFKRKRDNRARRK